LGSFRTVFLNETAALIAKQTEAYQADCQKVSVLIENMNRTKSISVLGEEEVGRIDQQKKRTELWVEYERERINKFWNDIVLDQLKTMRAEQELEVFRLKNELKLVSVQSTSLLGDSTKSASASILSLQKVINAEVQNSIISSGKLSALSKEDSRFASQVGIRLTGRNDGRKVTSSVPEVLFGNDLELQRLRLSVEYTENRIVADQTRFLRELTERESEFVVGVGDIEKKGMADIRKLEDEKEGVTGLLDDRIEVLGNRLKRMLDGESVSREEELKNELKLLTLRLKSVKDRLEERRQTSSANDSGRSSSGRKVMLAVPEAIIINC
jgi:hypothetical protein